jgi:hypothetical protein
MSLERLGAAVSDVSVPLTGVDNHTTFRLMRARPLLADPVGALIGKYVRFSALAARRIGEGQDGARMDDTRHGTLGPLAALDAAAILTCIYTPGRQRRAMAWWDCRE